MTTSKLPNKVNSFRTKLFFLRDFAELPTFLQSEILRLQKAGWTFSIVDQKCGYMHFSSKVICIPTWTCEPKHRPGRFIQYIAHEVAHAIHRIETPLEIYQKQDAHGVEFMHFMKELCPPEYWHFELSYKPMQAAASGILHDPEANVNNATQQKGTVKCLSM